MAVYTYTAKDKQGKTIRGTIEAANTAAASKLLRERDYIVVGLQEQKDRATLVFWFKKVKGVSVGERAVFARQLATMLTAGLPLTNALEVLGSQAKGEKMREIINEMQFDVEGGAPLSKSLKRYPHVFSKVFIALVEAGEASGSLDQILARLADNLEKERDFKAKTKGALIYPAVVFVAMVVVFIVMIMFVVPRLTSLYADLDISLPVTTRALIALSDLFVSKWWLLLALAVGTFAAFGKFRVTDYGRYKLAALAFKIPVFGKLNKEAELAEFTRTLGLLLGAGVPIMEALEITSGVMGNVLYKDAVVDAEKQVEKGVPLSVPLRENESFPPILAQMVLVGEETGKMDEVLLKVAAFFESEAEQTIRNLSSALEPIIMVVLGLMVGLLVLSIITPIYNLTTQF